MKKITFFLFILGCFALSLNAQVGINNPNPNKHAALDINGGKTKGILIPIMASGTRNELKSNYKNVQDNEKLPNGLLVYDEVQKIFYFFNGTDWIALNPLQADDGNTGTLKQMDGTTTVTLKNKLSVSQNVDVDKNITAKDTIKASVFEGYGVTPIGGIIMWSGNVNDVPENWAICDGTNKTPDLRQKFIAGYDNGDADYAIGKTGGSANVILQAYNLPEHKHHFGPLTTSSDGEHTHAFNDEVPNWAIERVAGKGAEAVLSNDAPIAEISYAGEHTHKVTGETDNNSTVNSAHENRPPYYVLAFIMRIK